MKISKEKRNQLIGVAIGTVAVIAGIWYLLINAQLAALAEISHKIDEGNDRELRMQTAVKLADKIQAELDAVQAQMDETGKGMASGDLYSWMYSTIKEFKAEYHVEIPQFSAVEQSDCTLMAKFPFKQVKMTISGAGYFHELGRFIADFENHFPQIRLQNLEISTGGAGASGDREKLSFRTEVIALVKSAETK